MMRIDLLCGDAIERMRELPSESIHCIVTSPPYYGLRDYGIEGQIGLENSPERYVERLVVVFREAKRVLRADGTLWLNLGDSYWGGKGKSSTAWSIAHSDRNTLEKPYQHVGGMGLTRPTDGKHPVLKPKDLIGIPWRVALALQEDGWYLRSDIVWYKPNGMPESVRDRCTASHEYVFMLAKEETYYYDHIAIMEPLAESTLPRAKNGVGCHKYANGAPGQTAHTLAKPREKGNVYHGIYLNGRNKRDVWIVPIQRYAGAHFAVFPERLVEPMILAATSEDGCCALCGTPHRRILKKRQVTIPLDDNAEQETQPASGFVLETVGWQPSCSCGTEERKPCIVLDPFCGSGTVGAVCARLGRSFIGIDLNPHYIQMAAERIRHVAPLWTTICITPEGGRNG